MKLFRSDYPLSSSFELINTSVNLVRKHIWAVFYLMFLPSLVLVVGSVLLQHAVKPTGTIEWNNAASVGLALMIIGMIWLVLSLPGAIIMQLQAVRGGTPEAFDCFRQGLRHIFPLIGLILLIELALIGGFLAFIVPGLFLARSFYLAQFYLVDQNLGPRKAMRKSRAESLPNAGYIWGTIGVVVLFSMVSSVFGSLPVVGYILSLGIGLIYAFGPALRYNEIKNLNIPEAITAKRNSSDAASN
jgi:hypothetical protein